MSGLDVLVLVAEPSLESLLLIVGKDRIVRVYVLKVVAEPVAVRRLSNQTGLPKKARL